MNIFAISSWHKNCAVFIFKLQTENLKNPLRPAPPHSALSLSHTHALSPFCVAHFQAHPLPLCVYVSLFPWAFPCIFSCPFPAIVLFCPLLLLFLFHLSVLLFFVLFVLYFYIHFRSFFVFLFWTISIFGLFVAALTHKTNNCHRNRYQSSTNQSINQTTSPSNCTNNFCINVSNNNNNNRSQQSITKTHSRRAVPKAPPMVT